MPKAIDGEFADPERTLEWARQRDLILTERSKGIPVLEIAKTTGLTPNYIYQLIREAAKEVRDRSVQVVEQRFLEHDERCEFLYRQIQERLHSGSVDNPIDHQAYAGLIRAAIAVMDRQAKLLGLDKDGVQRNNIGGYDWMNRATLPELEKAARELGVALPEKFDVKRA